MEVADYIHEERMGRQVVGLHFPGMMGRVGNVKYDEIEMINMAVAGATKGIAFGYHLLRILLSGEGGQET